MYKKLLPFLYERTRINLYPHSQYNHLHESILLPISLVEIDTVAGIFPVLWRRTADGAELCALTGLEPNHNLAFSDLSGFSHCHPLILRAYPFALGRAARRGIGRFWWTMRPCGKAPHPCRYARNQAS